MLPLNAIIGRHKSPVTGDENFVASFQAIQVDKLFLPSQFAMVTWLLSVDHKSDGLVASHSNPNASRIRSTAMSAFVHDETY